MDFLFDRQSTDIGDIELTICKHADGLNSSKDESEERGSCSRRDQLSNKDSTSSLGKSEETKDEDERSLEYTLAMIDTEALIYKKEIEQLLVDEGFSFCQTRWLQLTPEQVSDFYHDDYEQESFAQLVSYMSSGPIIVHVISKINAIEDWQKLMGPEKVNKG